MAVIGTAQERPDSPTMTLELNQRHYTRKFRVQTSSVNDGPITVVNATGIPKLFSAYVFGNDIVDQYALVREIRPERVGPAQLFWDVEVEYRTPEPYSRDRVSGGERDQSGSNDNPLLMLPEVETATERFEEVVWWVVQPASQLQLLNQGVAVPNPLPFQLSPCKNSAGQVFDPPPTRDASRLTLTITRNESIFAPHPAADILYADAVNADVFWGVPAGQCKCMGITARRETKELSGGNLFPYLKVTYKFAFKPTWQLQLLDAGSYYLDANSNQIAFRSKDGQPIVGPLNGKGGKLTPGATPVFQNFTVYNQIPFAPLALPQSFVQCA